MLAVPLRCILVEVGSCSCRGMLLYGRLLISPSQAAIQSQHPVVNCEQRQSIAHDLVEVKTLLRLQILEFRSSRQVDEHKGYARLGDWDHFFLSENAILGVHGCDRLILP